MTTLIVLLVIIFIVFILLVLSIYATYSKGDRKYRADRYSHVYDDPDYSDGDGGYQGGSCDD